MDTGNLLDRIHSPDDVRKLTPVQLDILCAEIRKELVDTISTNGGHLASNLGVVELTIAIHKVFHSPEDQIIWDVGHQCYTHKLLTGRREKFRTIRKYKGISGFTKPSESCHDPYGAGHSSTSISAAFGMAKAKSIRKDAGHVVAVIGDGALTGGLSYEGMNNAGRSRDNLTVILNDNKMSISKNVGAIARHLTHIRTRPGYFRAKDLLERILTHTGIVGRGIRRILASTKSAVKNLLYHSTIFEELGFYYLGPVDGHNIEETVRLLERAKSIKKPCLVHVMTVKGKGYTFAENDPRTFHGVTKFDVETGDLLSQDNRQTFSDIFGSLICRLAENDPSVCAITAAMAAGTGLTEFASRFRQRFFDVGIAEEHAAVFAAGLARNGMLPVFAVYSTFLQRCYDQLIHDVALQKLKVVFAIDRAGVVSGDGETHQGIFDTAFLNSIPGMTVYAPVSGEELKSCLYSCCYECEGPAALRYPKGAAPALPDDFRPTYGNYDLYPKQSAKVLLVTYGRLFAQAAAAARALLEMDIAVTVLKINRIKPVDTACFDIASYFEQIFFYEEGIRTGGIAEHFCMQLVEKGYAGKIHIHAIEDRFVCQGGEKELLEMLGLDGKSMTETIVRECRQ
jgi:1-deoxy-D-xylulose-5-phosphate synthase